MLTGLVFLIGMVTGYPFPWFIFVVTGVLDGLVFLPIMSLIVVPFSGRLLRQIFGRLWFLFGTASAEGTALVMTDGGYEYAPLFGNRARLSDGRVLELDEDATTWYRLGIQPFAVMADPEADFAEEYGVDDEIATTVVESDDVTLFPQHQRGNLPGFAWPKWGDGPVVSLARAINSLRGAGGVRISERTEVETLKDESEDTHRENMIRLYGSLTAMGLGIVTGLLIFGVFS